MKFSNLMTLGRKIVIGGYTLIIAVLGILYVPCYAVWGSANEKNIRDLVYVPVWELVHPLLKVNGFVVRYELCIPRIIYGFLLLSIIAILIMIILPNEKKQSTVSE